MSGHTPYLSVVVCTYNRADLLGDCLNSLLDQDYPASRYEVVVIDDGSSDGTREEVRARRDVPPTTAVRPDLRYVWQENSGLNAARNRGIGESRGELVSFLDDDELAPSGHLSRIAVHMEGDPELDGVGGPYRDLDDGTTSLPTCDRCSLAGHSMPFRRPTAVDHLFGGNMTLRRSALHRIGPFDEAISRQGSARGDETEWFHRAAGRLRLLYDPELWIWHRRDLFGLTTLVRHAFMQGLSVPEIHRKTGRSLRPRPLRLLRGLGHAVRRRCAQGLVVAAQETGIFAGYLRMLLWRPHRQTSR